MVDDCVFCKIVRGEIPAEKLLENGDFIVIKDAKPAVEGHVLVIPKKHCNSFLDLDKNLYQGFLDTIKEFAADLGQDFNLVINNGEDAGQVVNHLHLHILPRKKNDGFKVGP